MQTKINTRFSGITQQEIDAARHCLEFSKAQGVSQARVSVNKSTMDSVQLFNGQVDKVSHNADRSIYIYLFIDGKYGTYSTNRFGTDELEEFILKAIERTKMLAPDKDRELPDPARYAKGAVTGRELGLYDESYEEISSQDRMDRALSGSIYSCAAAGTEGWRLISEECEYSDSIDDNYLADTLGFEGRHTETSFSYWSEMTIEDSKGVKYSGYWWSSSPSADRMEIAGCSEKALEKAVAQIGPGKHRGGKFTMVVDNTSSSRLAAPLINALYASAIQQKGSFLMDSLGKKIFPEELTVRDMAQSYGMAGSRLFDSEGVATPEQDIISRGKVEMYFVPTYLSNKMGIPGTVDGPSRPVILPFLKGETKNLDCQEFEINLQAILRKAGDGILVTGFNGGNCNRTTGCFSYGIEGFAFRNGEITHPVKEMIITGDMISLWKSIIAAGDDARYGTRWQIPTLAFENVDFSA